MFYFCNQLIEIQILNDVFIFRLPNFYFQPRPSTAKDFNLDRSIYSLFNIGYDIKIFFVRFMYKRPNKTL